MTVHSAAIQVLKEADGASTSKEIVQMIHGAGLLRLSGKTPEATVRACLNTDIKKNGDKSSFIRVTPNTFALRKPNGCDASKESTQTDGAISSKPASLSFVAAAQNVLEEHGGHCPLHYRDITKEAIKSGWLVSSGKTPEATMYAQIVAAIKRQRMGGERPLFVQYEHGYFGLSSLMGDGLTFQIDQHN